MSGSYNVFYESFCKRNTSHWFLLSVHSCHIYSTVFEQVIIFSDDVLVFLGICLTLFLNNTFVFKSKPTANNSDSAASPLPPNNINIVL